MSEQLTSEMGAVFDRAQAREGQEPTIDAPPVPVPVKSDHPREKLTDDQITAEMEAVYNHVGAREEIKELVTPLEQRPMPPLPQYTRSIEDTMRSQYEWSNEKPAELKAAERGTWEQIEERKKVADKYGVTLDQHEEILQTEQIKRASELAPVVERAKAIYGGQHSESEIFSRFTEVAELYERDPKAAILFLAEAANLIPPQGGQQQPAQRQLTQAEHDAARHGIPQEQYNWLIAGVSDFLEKEMPEAKRWEKEITETILKGRISRTQNPIADLRAAAIHVMKKGRKSA